QDGPAAGGPQEVNPVHAREPPVDERRGVDEEDGGHAEPHEHRPAVLELFGEPVVEGEEQRPRRQRAAPVERIDDVLGRHERAAAREQIDLPRKVRRRGRVNGRGGRSAVRRTEIVIVDGDQHGGSPLYCGAHAEAGSGNGASSTDGGTGGAVQAGAAGAPWAQGVKVGTTTRSCSSTPA